MSTMDAQVHPLFVPAKLREKRSGKSWLVWLHRVAVLVAVFGPASAAAGSAAPSTVTLLWDRNVEREVTGYRVYFGTGSGQYISSLDVGNETTAFFADLASGVDHFFAVTALDAEGLESGYSAEVRYRWDQPGPERPGNGGVPLQIHTGSRPVALTVAGTPGQTHAIDATTDFVTWITIGMVTLGASGAVDFVDPVATRFPGRYYRHTEIVPSGPLQIHADSHGAVSLTVAGTPGRTYAIDATVDFVSWTTLGTVAVGAGGSVDFVDAAATRFPGRFYRHREADAPIALQLTPEDEFLITVTGPAGGTFVIETTEDNRTWTTLGQVTTGADGLANYADAEASRHAFRLYRAWQQL